MTVWERREGRLNRSDILLADAKHTESDVFVSLSVLIGLILVRFGWGKADAVISIAITGLIAWAAWTIVQVAMAVLTDATDVDARSILRSILEKDGVETAHKLRMRASGGRVLALVDITVDPDLTVMDGHEIASRVEIAAKASVGTDTSVTVHVEPALGRHTRPDLLFGDVRARNRDNER